MLKRPSNKPRDEIVRLARKAIANSGGPTLARVFYKYDCGGCGSREQVATPNELPDVYVCSVCQHETRILGAGFALHQRRAVTVPWDAPVTLIVRKPYETDRGDA